MNDAIRISRPADILGFIPHALGFAPRESFRVPDPAREHTRRHTPRRRTQVRGSCRFRTGHDGLLAVDNQAASVLLAIYTDGSPAAATQRPFHDYVEAVIRELEIAGTPLKDAWLVTSERWQNLLCDSDAGCCQPEPLESITDGQLNAELVFRGSSYQKEPGTSYAPFTGPADTAETSPAGAPPAADQR